MIHTNEQKLKSKKFYLGGRKISLSILFEHPMYKIMCIHIHKSYNI